MPLIIPEGFAEIALELVSAGDPDPWYVTWGVAHTTDPDDGEAIGQSANWAWNTAVHTGLASNIAHTGCKVTVGTGDEPLRLFVPQTASAQAGGQADNRLPQNCALLVRKNTAFGGRRNRGRFFVPGMLGETTVNGVGRIDAPTVSALQELFDDFKANLAEDLGAELPSTPMVLLHHSEGVSVAGPPTPIQSLSVDATISTQRRRLR